MDAVSGKSFPSINPSTGEVICEVAEGDKVIIIHLVFFTHHLHCQFETIHQKGEVICEVTEFIHNLLIKN